MSKSASRAKASASSRRSSARLAAVQALYQIALSDNSAAQVIADRLARREPREAEEPPLIPAHQTLFRSIVTGVEDARATLDEMIDANLSGGARSERLEPLLRAILRAGAWELWAGNGEDTPIVISDYVDVTKAFYEGSEPGLVNAVLDALARLIRAGEVATPANMTADPGG